MNWMKEADAFMTADDANIGDLSTLEAQLEQSNVRNRVFLVLHKILHY